LVRPGDLKLFGRRLASGASFDEKWIEMMAPFVDRAREFDRAFSLGCPERFDEIRSAFREWSSADEASCAATGLPELLRAHDGARRYATDLRRRASATAARTVEGMIAKLAALVAVQGREVIDDDLDMAMGEPTIDIDAVFLSVARDCGRLAACGALTAAG
jgi:hypothetical protein